MRAPGTFSGSTSTSDAEQGLTRSWARASNNTLLGARSQSIFLGVSQHEAEEQVLAILLLALVVGSRYSVWVLPVFS